MKRMYSNRKDRRAIWREWKTTALTGFRGGQEGIICVGNVGEEPAVGDQLLTLMVPCPPKRERTVSSGMLCMGNPVCCCKFLPESLVLKRK